MDGGKGKGKGWNRLLLIGGAVAIVAVIAAVIVSFLTKGKSTKRQTVHQIAILKPPPPPPPPKPPEKPPEPEMKKEEVKVPEPDKTPEPAKAEAAPASPDLGVDAAGAGNGDAFGLVGKPGGKDITTIGGGAGQVGNRFAPYAGRVLAEIQKGLTQDKRLRGAEFKAVLKIWLASDGKVQRAELSGSTGNAKTDELIQLALADIPPMREVPPPDMPQPIRVRVTSRF